MREITIQVEEGDILEINSKRWRIDDFSFGGIDLYDLEIDELAKCRTASEIEEFINDHAHTISLVRSEYVNSYRKSKSF